METTTNKMVLPRKALHALLAAAEPAKGKDDSRSPLMGAWHLEVRQTNVNNVNKVHMTAVSTDSWRLVKASTVVDILDLSAELLEQISVPQGAVVIDFGNVHTKLKDLLPIAKSDQPLVTLEWDEGGDKLKIYTDDSMVETVLHGEEFFRYRQLFPESYEVSTKLPALFNLEYLADMLKVVKGCGKALGARLGGKTGDTMIMEVVHMIDKGHGSNGKMNKSGNDSVVRATVWKTTVSSSSGPSVEIEYLLMPVRRSR